MPEKCHMLLAGYREAGESIYRSIFMGTPLQHAFVSGEQRVDDNASNKIPPARHRWIELFMNAEWLVEGFLQRFLQWQGCVTSLNTEGGRSREAAQHDPRQEQMHMQLTNYKWCMSVKLSKGFLSTPSKAPPNFLSFTSWSSSQKEWLTSCRKGTSSKMIL